MDAFGSSSAYPNRCPTTLCPVTASDRALALKQLRKEFVSAPSLAERKAAVSAAVGMLAFNPDMQANALQAADIFTSGRFSQSLTNQMVNRFDLLLGQAIAELEAPISGITSDPLSAVELVCERFHTVCRQLRSRHDYRPTLDVQDEYDIQDLLHALLLIHFRDVRAEEWTPSYAGRSARMDFLIKQEQVVVETKHTRRGLGAREIGDQLIEDIARYESHPDCRALICFVYDPAGLIANPRGIENDLRRLDGSLRVEVFIRP